MLIIYCRGRDAIVGLRFFLQQFWYALDRCRAQFKGRANFPFALELFCLFFERSLVTRSLFDLHPPTPMTKAQMHMWGHMLPKRAKSMFPTRITSKRVDLLASEDENNLDMVACPYVGLD